MNSIKNYILSERFISKFNEEYPYPENEFFEKSYFLKDIDISKYKWKRGDINLWVKRIEEYSINNLYQKVKPDKRMPLLFKDTYITWLNNKTDYSKSQIEDRVKLQERMIETKYWNDFAQENVEVGWFGFINWAIEQKKKNKTQI